MNEVKIGVDISTKSIAWACLINDKPVILEKDNNQIVLMGETKFNKDKKEKQLGMQMFWNDCKSIEALLAPLYWLGREYNNQALNKDQETKIFIAIENAEILNSFAAVKTTKKLSLYAGMLIGVLYETLESGFALWLKKENCKVKLITPFEWQKHYDGLITGKRDLTKLKSIEYANEYLKSNNFENVKSDNLSDAINIARVAHIVRDAEYVKYVNKFHYSKPLYKLKITTRLKKLENRIKSKKNYDPNIEWTEQLTPRQKATYKVLINRLEAL